MKNILLLIVLVCATFLSPTYGQSLEGRKTIILDQEHVLIANFADDIALPIQSNSTKSAFGTSSRGQEVKAMHYYFFSNRYDMKGFSSFAEKELIIGGYRSELRPQAVQASPTAQEGIIKISWDALPGASNYLLLRDIDPTKEIVTAYALIDAKGQSTFTYNDKEVKPGESHLYHLLAFNIRSNKSSFFLSNAASVEGKAAWSGQQVQTAFTALDLKVDPNPVQGQKLHCTIMGRDADSGFLMRVMDSSGAILKEEEFSASAFSNENPTLTLEADYKKGMYLLQVIQGEILKTVQFVIE